MQELPLYSQKGTTTDICRSKIFIIFRTVEFIFKLVKQLKMGISDCGKTFNNTLKSLSIHVPNSLNKSLFE